MEKGKEEQEVEMVDAALYDDGRQINSTRWRAHIFLKLIKK